MRDTSQCTVDYLVEAEVPRADPVNVEDPAECLGREARRQDPAHFAAPVTARLRGQSGHAAELARLLRGEKRQL